MRFAALFFIINWSLWAQQRPQMHYTVRDGLAQMQVVAVLEDSRGYIWAGTKGGISKFNGERFENLTQKDGLNGYVFSYIIEDKNGNMWFTYQHEGIGKFDGQKITNIKNSVSERYSAAFEFKRQIYFLKYDSLYKVDGLKAIFTGRTIAQFKNSNPIPICLNEEIYVTNEKGVYYSTNAFKNIIQIGTIAKNEVQTLFNYKNHSIYLISSANSIAAFRLKGGKKFPIFSMKNGQFKSFEKFQHSFIFSDTKQDGYLYHGTDHTVEKVNDGITNFTSSNYIGPTNRVYFGSEFGLHSVITNSFKYFPQTQVPYAWGLTEDKQGDIWIQSYLSNLQKYDGKTITNYKDYYQLMLKNGFRDEGQCNSWYFHPITDHKGRPWLNVMSGLLFRDQAQWQFVPGPKNKGSFFYISFDSLRHKILAGSQGGFTVVDAEPPYRQNFITYPDSMFAADRFIMATVVDKDGNYWLTGKNICRYNPNTKAFKIYAKYHKNNDLQRFNNIHIDAKGGIWAGSYRGGLVFYDKKADKFKHVFKEIKDNFVCYTGQISDKYLIVGAQSGIYVLDMALFYRTGAQRIVKVLNYQNGYIGLEPGQAGFFKDSKNRVWLTSGSELSYFEPAKMKFENQPLALYLRKINNDRIPFNYQNLTWPITKDLNDLKIELEALGDGKPAFPEYSYRVPGFRPNWSPWQTDNSIYLTNMPIGVHTIQVRTKHNLANELNYPSTQVKIKIDIPFYRSPDFYQKALFTFMALVATIAVFFWHFRRQARALRQQTRQNHEQDQKIKMLQVQSTQAQLNPHFIFNVLQTVQSDILIKNNPEEASQNLLGLSELIRSFLSSSVIDSNQNQSVYQLEISLEREIELLRSYINFEKNAKNNFEYSLEIKPPLNIVNYRLQPLLIQPFVENAIKHGFQGFEQQWKLHILFEEVDEALICTITDNGIGRTAAAKIQNESIKKYKSLGTDLVHKRMQMLNQVGYQIETHTTDLPKGTQVRIKIDFVGLVKKDKI